MKKILSLLFLLMGLNISYAQGGVQHQIYREQIQSEGRQKMEREHNQLANDCGHLSDQEFSFAKKLSVMHRTMFCRHFSVAQRMEAMTLADEETPIKKQDGTTPDEAVETIMKNSRDQKAEMKEKSPYSRSRKY